MNPPDDRFDVGVSIRLGAHLRAVRRQKHLSLKAVEIASAGEFKASVLGAYERGDRAISVPRLQRLARLYRVPLADMVPHDDHGAPPSVSSPLIIDLVALRQHRGPDVVLLDRYLRAIEIERGDYNGRVLTIRHSDTVALASILACPFGDVPARLDDLGIRIH